MNYNLYVIYDKVSEQYSAPFTSLNDATAVRHFNSVTRGNSMAEPSDFELYGVGIFNTDSASFALSSKLRFITKGSVPDA